MTWLDTALKITQLLTPWLAAIVGLWGLSTWRRQSLGNARIKAAEEVLVAATRLESETESAASAVRAVYRLLAETHPVTRCDVDKIISKWTEEAEGLKPLSAELYVTIIRARPYFDNKLLNKSANGMALQAMKIAPLGIALEVEKSAPKPDSVVPDALMNEIKRHVDNLEIQKEALSKYYLQIEEKLGPTLDELKRIPLLSIGRIS
jgi:hypothetical protein